MQTAEHWSQEPQNGPEDGDLDDPTGLSQSPRKQQRLSLREKEREDELRTNLRKEIEEELKALKDPTPAVLSDEAASRFPARALTAEEMNAVTSSGEFLDFIDRSSKVIERALDQEYDILADYALDGVEELEDDDADEAYRNSSGRKGTRIKSIGQFYDERWCKKRMISDINFSPKVQASRKSRVCRLTCLVPRAVAHLLYQKPFSSSRSFRLAASREPPSALQARIHFP